MSKSAKSKSAPAAKASKSDVLSKVKGAAVTKPAQSDKSKSKDIAKKVAAKEEKRSKKVPVKEPTPESSSDEEEEDSESEESASESESESEVDTKKTKKTNGVKVAPKDASSDEESSEESDSEESASDESDAEEAVPKANGAAKAAVKATEDSDDSDESSEEESDEEEEAAPKTNGTKPAEAESEDSDEEDSASEEDSDESSEEEKVEKKSSKRKAEDTDSPAAKKTKVETTDADTSRGPNLFVGNLSWNVDEEWLRSEFESFGELSGVRLMTDRQTGRSKGFGYVEFVNAADAAKAQTEKHGADLDGRALNVDFANARPDAGPKQDNRRKSYGDQVSEPSDTLFLGNLSFDCTQEDVTDAFGPHGTVLGIRLPTDRETGAPKGFGYVTFASVDEAQAALEAMQGGYIKSRPVRLDYSQPRQQNDSPARGGFGGGGRGGGRGGFGGRGGRGGGRGDFGGRGGRGGRGGARGGRGGSYNRGGFGDFSGTKVTF
ncbi:nuclear localization sequence binding protein [Rhinocladiella similis]